MNEKLFNVKIIVLNSTT